MSTATNLLGKRASFLAGLKEVSPILLSAAPFGMVCGVGAAEAGLSIVQAIVFSFAVFAGASQIIATQFMASGAPALVVIAAALAVNLRFLMYSASLVPYFGHYRAPLKLLLSYLLTDQAYALSINAYTDEQRRVSRLAYYFGAALGLLVAFQIGQLVGVLMGASLPASWGVEFSVPLIFLALLIPSLKTRSMYVSVAVAAVATLAMLALPYMLGVFIAALIAIAAGFIHQEATGDGH